MKKRPEDGPKTFTCPHCQQEFRIKKVRFAKQQMAGHVAMCSKNPGSRAFKSGAPAGPPPALEPGELAPGAAPGPAQGPDLSQLQGYLASPGSAPPPGQVPTIGSAAASIPPAPMMVGEEYIPPEVCREIVLLFLSVNLDIAIAKAKKKHLKEPEKLPMGSETSQWIGRMISRELGPQKSSWTIIGAALAPFFIYPWAQIYAQDPKSPFKKILEKFKGAQKEVQDDDEKKEVKKDGDALSAARVDSG